MSDVPLRPDEVPNPQIRCHAQQIARAALLLYRHMATEHCVPSVLLEAALASELYLKSLNARTQHHPLEYMQGHILTAHYAGGKRHNLTQIYDEIDQPIRDELQCAYAAVPVLTGEATLRGALAPFDTLFVEIRYVFECQDPGSPDITNLISLLRFLMRVIDGMPVDFLVPSA